MTQEKLPHRKELCLQSETPSHMCEGVFLFLQLFKLTTSNWFGHTVRAQRVHEVRGTSAWTDRSGAETPRGPGDLGLDRPKRRP